MNRRFVSIFYCVGSHLWAVRGFRSHPFHSFAYAKVEESKISNDLRIYWQHWYHNDTIILRVFESLFHSAGPVHRVNNFIIRAILYVSYNMIHMILS